MLFKYGEMLMRVGRSGENSAEIFLKNKGLKIIERNFRCRKGEIDLVVMDVGILIFVEVKTRNSLKYGFPSESITPYKIKHIKSTAYWYINMIGNDHRDLDIRFDVVEILRLKNRQYIRHIENAF